MLKQKNKVEKIQSRFNKRLTKTVSEAKGLWHWFFGPIEMLCAKCKQKVSKNHVHLFCKKENCLTFDKVPAYLYEQLKRHRYGFIFSLIAFLLSFTTGEGVQANILFTDENGMKSTTAEGICLAILIISIFVFVLTFVGYCQLKNRHNGKPNRFFNKKKEKSPIILK